MINKNTSETFWFFDENLMLLEQGWQSANGGDAVGRNAFMYIFHPDQSWLKETLLACIKTRDDSFVQMYRYPNRGADTMSRDHVSAIIIALFINRDWVELEWVLDNLPLQLSRRYWQTPDFWLWQRALKARIEQKPLKYRILRQLFFLTVMVQFVLILPWNWLIRSLVRVKKIKIGSEFQPLTGWRKWAYQKLIYPHFALYNMAWQNLTLKLNPHSILARMLRLEAQNPVIKAILGREITQEEYDGFVSTNTFQWAGTHDTGVDREVRELKPSERKFNDINKSNLDYFWFGIDKIMLNGKERLVAEIKHGNNIIFY